MSYFNKLYCSISFAREKAHASVWIIQRYEDPIKIQHGKKCLLKYITIRLMNLFLSNFKTNYWWPVF